MTLTLNSEVDFVKFDSFRGLPSHLGWMAKDVRAMANRVITDRWDDRQVYNILYLAHLLTEEQLELNNGFVRMENFRYSGPENVLDEDCPVSAEQILTLIAYIKDLRKEIMGESDTDFYKRQLLGKKMIEHFIINSASYSFEVVQAGEADVDVDADAAGLPEESVKTKTKRASRKSKKTTG